MTMMQQIILILIVYILVYALIDRICKCIEHCAIARAYGKFKEAEYPVNRDDLVQKIMAFKKGMNGNGTSGATEDGAQKQN